MKIKNNSLNVFKILVSYFNTNLNGFIVDHGTVKIKEIDRHWTGGQYDIVSTHKEMPKYYQYALQLEKIREKIFQISNKIENVTAEKSDEIVNDVFALYESAVEHFYKFETNEEPQNIDNEFLVKIRKMFKELDKDLKTTKFEKQINEIHLKWIKERYPLKKFELKSKNIIQKIRFGITKLTNPEKAQEIQGQEQEFIKKEEEKLKKEIEQKEKQEMKRIWDLKTIAGEVSSRFL